jgi:hypothetical protein
MLIKQNKRERHFGRYNEPAILKGELSELTYPKSPISTQGRFRTNELTRLVPVPVRSVLLASLRELKVAE